MAVGGKIDAESIHSIASENLGLVDATKPGH